jgi:hypothetical protein
MDQEREFSNHSTDMDQEREVSNQSSDTDQEWEVTSHKTEIRKIVAHPTEIEVVYTDDNHKAAEIVDMYEQWLSKDEYKFMGLDFEYCDPEYEGDYRIAVVQLAMKDHVLVYQWSRYVYLIFTVALANLKYETRFYITSIILI